MNKNISILKNQAGVSMIQVIIVGAMMVGIATVGMRIQENQKKAQKGLEQKREGQSVAELMKGILKGTTACSNTFSDLAGGTAPGGNIPTIGQGVELADGNIYDASGNPVFVKGQRYGSVIYQGIRVFNGNPEDPSDTSAGIDITSSPPPLQGVMYASLIFQRAKKRESDSLGSNFAVGFFIYVNLNASVMFDSCYDMSSGDVETIAKRVCEGIGASWDDPDDMTSSGGANGPEPPQCIAGSIFWENTINQQAMCESLGFYWDNAESKCNKYVRGAHYGGCSKELMYDTTFMNSYNQVWPVLDCSTNPPTCDVGFKAVQLAGGLVNVTPFGELRAEMSSIWETWACAKQ